MTKTEIFYHGSCYLFDKFSLSFLGTGEGKSKYGHGIYITSSYKTAALYAAKAAKANGKENCYVYTVEVPKLIDGNHIYSAQPVNKDIVSRVEAAIGETFPDEVKEMGKFFRKYLGNLLIGNRRTVKQMRDSASLTAEDAASEFLDRLGIVFLVWPRVQKKPEQETNRAVLNIHDIKILKIEQVECNDKNRLIEGSEIIVKNMKHKDNDNTYSIALEFDKFVDELKESEEFDSFEYELTERIYEAQKSFENLKDFIETSDGYYSKDENVLNKLEKTNQILDLIYSFWDK